MLDANEILAAARDLISYPGGRSLSDADWDVIMGSLLPLIARRSTRIAAPQCATDVFTSIQDGTWRRVRRRLYGGCASVKLRNLLEQELEALIGNPGSDQAAWLRFNRLSEIAEVLGMMFLCGEHVEQLAFHLQDFDN